MLKETRGFDFTGYKRSTLMRRVRRRMDARGLGSLSEYRDYLELESEEFNQLFDSLLINVTGFFRDPLAWQALREEVLPELLSAKSARRPLRVWSAGCATGEEAYTLAIVLVEAMGLDEFIEPGEDLRHRPRRGRPGRGAHGHLLPNARFPRSARSSARNTSRPAAPNMPSAVIFAGR